MQPHNMSQARFLLLIVLSSVAGGAVARAEPPSEFDRTIAPLFARRCLGCHNPSDKKGGFDLTGSRPALAGGDSGVVIVAGKPNESLLWEKVSQNEMPPKKP